MRANKILYVGNFSFPKGNAAGARVLGNGYLLRDLGYDVVFIGLDISLPHVSFLKDTRNSFDNFRYYNFPYPVGIKGWLSFYKRYHEIIAFTGSENPYAVIIYGSPTLSLFLLLLRKWCGKKKIKFISDCPDWLPSNSGNPFFRFIKYLDTMYQIRILNPYADGVIVVSSFLSDFYNRRGCKTVIIPPLVNLNHFSHLRNIRGKDDNIKLIYIGQPFAVDGRRVKKSAYKDRLDVVIETLLKLRDFKFNFDIYGLTKEQYLSVVKHQTDKINNIGNRIQFHGYIRNSDAIIRISEADFLVLFRDINRMTMAGFPTKVVESITCGTPVITTDTSDLKKFIKEGMNGYFVKMTDEDQLLGKMKEILSVDHASISYMKQSCFESQLFSYQNYLSLMSDFISSLD